MELIKRGYWQRIKKGGVKTAGEAEMPHKWTTPAWECFVDYGLPRENWQHFLPDLETPKPMGKRPNSRAVQRKMIKAAKQAEVAGRTQELGLGKHVS